MQTLEIFNSLSGEREVFTPINGRQVRMYVCGPTVYDAAHLGHARCYITWDVLYRLLKFLGYEVTYVRNVTDVDDKILNRAKELNISPQEVAQKNYALFQEDMRALNVLDPDREPRATEHIADMISGIQTLIEKKAAYATGDGSVYFRVASKNDYGKLKFRTRDLGQLAKHLDDLQAGARVEVDEEKESPLDFALWKGVPLEDPNGWESPWPATNQTKGRGRPGWHMECSAMNHAIFGEQIDIHAGGADLIFPHHENEIAQSEAWTGHQPFAKYWMHNGFVNVSGEKMSKSLGNFSTIKKVLERYDANTIRYFLLTNSYRKPVDFNDEALVSAQTGVQRLQRSLLSGLKKAGIETEAQALKSLCVPQASAFAEAALDERFQTALAHLQKDINTAEALSFLRNLAMQLDASDADKAMRLNLARQTLTLFETVLGFSVEVLVALEAESRQLPREAIARVYAEITESEAGESQSAERLLETLLMQRKDAKKLKDWAHADAIRNRITEIGLQILDNKDGTSSVEKDGHEIVRIR